MPTIEEIRLALGKSRRKRMINKKDEQKEKVLKQVSNPSCSEDILVKASEDNENYTSSRVRRAVALNKNAPKSIIDKLLKDEYRWVREAAASHELVKDKEISNLVKSGDRYILKGLLENPNSTDGIETEITEKLEDESKYPIETDIYIIKGQEGKEYIGGSMTVEEMVEIIVSGFVPSYPNILPGEWYEYNDLYHFVDDCNLNNNIILPDGTDENLILVLKTSITDCDADFVIFCSVGLEGYGGDYELELEELFDPTNIIVNEEFGLVKTDDFESGYEYESESEWNSFDRGEGKEIEGATADGWDNPVGWEQLNIQVKGVNGYEDIYLEDVIPEMKKNGVDLSDAKAVLKYLKETYDL